MARVPETSENTLIVLFKLGDRQIDDSSSGITISALRVQRLFRQPTHAVLAVLEVGPGPETDVHNRCYTKPHGRVD
jgi:hypothetical protein